MTTAPTHKFSPRAYWLVVAIQVLILLAMIGGRLHVLRTGTAVRLECQPVDPRSLLSGDYVILNYKISSLGRKEDRAPLNVFNETFNRSGQRIYVALEKQGAFHVATAYSRDLRKLRAAGHDTIIRGVVTSVSSWNLRIRYGVEAYFVPQFQGLDIERNLSDTSVEVAIARSGESAIKRLFIDGQEVTFH